MTEHELQSARAWAAREILDGETPAEGQLVSAIVEHLRENNLVPDDQFIDAATLLLCDADTLPPRYEFVIDDFHREQLRQEIRDFAEHCWKSPEAERRAAWDQLQLRASGDLVLKAILGELRPLLLDVENHAGITDEQATLLQNARAAAALRGRLGSAARRDLMTNDSFDRASIEQLAARLPESSRWIQRLLVPASISPAGRRAEKQFLGDWVEDAVAHDRSETLQWVLIKILIGVMAGGLVMGALSTWFGGKSRNEAPRDEPVINYSNRDLKLLEKLRKLMNKEADSIRANKKRATGPATTEPIDDRPPPPPVAVPLTDPFDKL